MQETWVRKISWRREWLPTPVFLPGEFHGQRSLAGYSPWEDEQSDTTELLKHLTRLRDEKEQAKETRRLGKSRTAGRATVLPSGYRGRPVSGGRQTGFP